MAEKEITLPEACQQLGEPWTRAWRLVLDGTLPARKVRGRWLVERSAVEALRDKRQVDASPLACA